MISTQRDKSNTVVLHSWTIDHSVKLPGSVTSYIWYICYIVGVGLVIGWILDTVLYCYGWVGYRLDLGHCPMLGLDWLPVGSWTLSYIVRVGLITDLALDIVSHCYSYSLDIGIVSHHPDA